MILSIYLLMALCAVATLGQSQWTAIDSINSGGLHSIEFVNADTGFAYNELGCSAERWMGVRARIRWK
ncbi:MAG: hypothetical protein U5L96_17470 [Owenweeksia sp.]|nr:hypothetical protein [Owenweeksia sp.]